MRLDSPNSLSIPISRRPRKSSPSSSAKFPLSCQPHFPLATGSWDSLCKHGAVFVEQHIVLDDWSCCLTVRDCEYDVNPETHNLLVSLLDLASHFGDLSTLPLNVVLDMRLEIL